MSGPPLMIYEERILDAVGLTILTPQVRESLDNLIGTLERDTDRYFGPIKLFEPQRLIGGPEALYLNETPVIDEDSDPVRVLTIEKSTALNVWEEVDSADYEIWYSGKPNQPPRIVMIGGWPAWTRLTTYYANLQATYWAGYEPGQLPRDIERVLLRKLRADYQQTSVDGGLKKESIGALYSYERFEGGDMQVQEDWDKTVQLWRTPVFA